MSEGQPTLLQGGVTRLYDPRAAQAQAAFAKESALDTKAFDDEKLQDIGKLQSLIDEMGGLDEDLQPYWDNILAKQYSDSSNYVPAVQAAQQPISPYPSGDKQDEVQGNINEIYGVPKTPMQSFEAFKPLQFASNNTSMADVADATTNFLGGAFGREGLPKGLANIEKMAQYLPVNAASNAIRGYAPGNAPTLTGMVGRNFENAMPALKAGLDVSQARGQAGDPATQAGEFTGREIGTSVFIPEAKLASLGTSVGAGLLKMGIKGSVNRFINASITNAARQALQQVPTDIANRAQDLREGKPIGQVAADFALSAAANAGFGGVLGAASKTKLVRSAFFGEKAKSFKKLGVARKESEQAAEVAAQALAKKAAAETEILQKALEKLDSNFSRKLDQEQQFVARRITIRKAIAALNKDRQYQVIVQKEKNAQIRAQRKGLVEQLNRQEANEIMGFRKQLDDLAIAKVDANEAYKQEKRAIVDEYKPASLNKYISDVFGSRAMPKTAAQKQALRGEVLASKKAWADAKAQAIAGVEARARAKKLEFERAKQQIEENAGFASSVYKAKRAELTTNIKEIKTSFREEKLSRPEAVNALKGATAEAESGAAREVLLAKQEQEGVTAFDRPVDIWTGRPEDVFQHTDEAIQLKVADLGTGGFDTPQLLERGVEKGLLPEQALEVQYKARKIAEDIAIGQNAFEGLVKQGGVDNAVASVMAKFNSGEKINTIDSAIATAANKELNKMLEQASDAGNLLAQEKINRQMLDLASAKGIEGSTAGQFINSLKGEGAFSQENLLRAAQKLAEENYTPGSKKALLANSDNQLKLKLAMDDVFEKELKESNYDINNLLNDCP